MSRDVKHVEVWVDYANPGGYLLTLREFTDGTFEIRDPQKGGEVLDTFGSRDDAIHWLGEDEYEPIGKLDFPTKDNH